MLRTDPLPSAPTPLRMRFGRGRGGIIRMIPGVPVVRDLGGPPPPPATDTFPGDWRVFNRAAATGRRVPVSDANGLRTAIGNAQSGDRILLPPGGNITLGGDLVINKAVSGLDAYYIATDTDSEDPSALCRLTGGNIVFNGARRAVVHGIRQVGNRVKAKAFAKFCQIERVWYSGLVNTTGDAYAEDAWFMTEGSAPKKNDADVSDFLIGFIHNDSTSCSFYDQEGGNAAYRLLITHVFLDRTTGANKFLQPGRNPSHGLVYTDSIAQYSLEQGSRRNYADGNDPDWCELKQTGWHIRFNTSHESLELKIRQGREGEAGDGGRNPSNRGNVIEGNLWVNVNVQNSTRGCFHNWINNWCVKLGARENPSRDSGLGTGAMNIQVGVSEAQTFPPSGSLPPGCIRRINAYTCRFGGNRGFTVRPQRVTSCKPTIKPRNCIATRTGKGRNTSAPDSSDWGSGTDFTTQIAGADIDKIPRRMYPEDVGPRAWRREFADVVG